MADGWGRFPAHAASGGGTGRGAAAPIAGNGTVRELVLEGGPGPGRLVQVRPAGAAAVLLVVLLATRQRSLALAGWRCSGWRWSAGCGAGWSSTAWGVLAGLGAAATLAVYCLTAGRGLAGWDLLGLTAWTSTAAACSGRRCCRGGTTPCTSSTTRWRCPPPSPGPSMVRWC